ncbi:hypothetical protein CCGE525_12065 [Rhizobium jaguaris]|uniref:Uncharacterized protein n=1 Tax=Rhizobium jaguaris TaxID=1312183 RepID=A0A387FLY7_9HYPH|nr:hypothetical protein CCGE525_12065 [Rhizobium jaguaris]
MDPMVISLMVLGVALAPYVSSHRPEPRFIAGRFPDCSDIVERVLLKTKGRLLSMRPHADRCTVTVLVPRDGDRPEKVVVRVQFSDDDVDETKE